MRNALVALVAVVSLALAGGLVAAPKKMTTAQQASAGISLDIFNLTQRARDLPEQSYPAH
jgi:hypothetical protein